MNTYEFDTLPKTWQAGFGCCSATGDHAGLWVHQAYSIVLDAMDSLEFSDFLHLKWLLRDLGELLIALFEV